MSHTDVWIAFIKSKPLEGCGIDIDGSDYYFAEAYVPVNHTEIELVSFDNVIAKIKNSLLEGRLILCYISKCIRYQQEHWNTDTDSNKEAHSLAESALSSNKVEFGAFRSEEIEELVQYQHILKELD